MLANCVDGSVDEFLVNQWLDKNVNNPDYQYEWEPEDDYDVGLFVVLYDCLADVLGEACECPRCVPSVPVCVHQVKYLRAVRSADRQ